MDSQGDGWLLRGTRPPVLGLRMSTDALQFLWGEPYNTAGDARRYAHWYYLGSSFYHDASGYHPWDFGTRVDVYLVAGKVVGWVDVPPSTLDKSSGSSGN